MFASITGDDVLEFAKSDVFFMNCIFAMLDSAKSIVFYHFGALCEFIIDCGYYREKRFDF